MRLCMQMPIVFVTRTQNKAISHNHQPCWWLGLLPWSIPRAESKNSSNCPPTAMRPQTAPKGALLLVLFYRLTRKRVYIFFD